MAIRVTSLLMTSRVSLPSPASYNLLQRETKVFPYIEYDKFINDPRIVDYLRKQIIYVEDLDVDAVEDYVSQWDQEPKLRMGVYVYWVDATGALRIKIGDPTFDLDGFIVGPGGAPVAHGSTHVFYGADPIPDIEVLEEPWSCTVTESVRDAVYAVSSDTANRADNGSTATMPVVGLVLSKPTATTCILVRSGELSGFAGLTPGASYYAGTTGGITTTAPSASGEVAQRIGYAKNSTTLVVERGIPIVRA